MHCRRRRLALLLSPGGRGADVPTALQGWHVRRALPRSARSPTLLVALVLAIGLLPIPLASASIVNITVVPYVAAGYRYQVVASGAEEGFEAPDYDDSAFSTGGAAFGTESDS